MSRHAKVALIAVAAWFVLNQAFGLLLLIALAESYRHDVGLSLPAPLMWLLSAGWLALGIALGVRWTRPQGQ